MNLESILAHLSTHGVRLGDTPASTAPMFTKEDKIAVIGQCWKKSPVGFLVLFADILQQESSKEELEDLLQQRFIRACDEARGTIGPYVPYLLARLALEEITHEKGQICGECQGTGKQKTKKNQLRKCQACVDGMVPWDDHVRFGWFAHQLPILQKRFRSLLSIYHAEIDALRHEKNVARLIIEERFNDEKEAIGVAA